MSVKVCAGGTFNVIHRGHLALLRRAFEEGDMVFVGLTSDAMARRGRAVPVKPYNERLEMLRAVLKSLSGGKPYRVQEIFDELGFAAEAHFDVIVVSEETQGNAKKINDARKARGLRPLKVVVIGMVIGPDGERISSTRLTRG